MVITSGWPTDPHLITAVLVWFRHMPKAEQPHGPLCICTAKAEELPRPASPGCLEARPPRAGDLGQSLCPALIWRGAPLLLSSPWTPAHPPIHPLLCLAATVWVWTSKLIFGWNSVLRKTKEQFSPAGISLLTAQKSYSDLVRGSVCLCMCVCPGRHHDLGVCALVLQVWPTGDIVSPRGVKINTCFSTPCCSGRTWP